MNIRQKFVDLKSAINTLNESADHGILDDEISDVVGYFHDYEQDMERRALEADSLYMDVIYSILNGTEWDAETVEQVAAVVEESGRKIKDPNVIDDVSIHFGDGTETDTIAEMFTHHHGHIIDIETINGPFTAKLIDTDSGGLEAVLFGPADLGPDDVVEVPDDAPTVHLTWEEVGAITIH